MSGGSWDYAFHRVNDTAERLATSKDPLRRAFAQHLLKVAQALHDIEWVDSGDYGPGDEHAAIKTALGKDHQAQELATVAEDARQLITQLQHLLIRMDGK